MGSLIIFLTITCGLLLDQMVPLWGQTLVNLWTWFVFLTFVVFAPQKEKVGLIICLFYATLGELFLSLIWGLYEYRLGHLPFFVPPGHVLLYLLGARLSPKLPHWVVPAIPGLMAPYIVFSIFKGYDTQSALWFVVFLVFLKLGKDKRLYSLMFLMALVMEIYGTWLGNWTWAREVPLLNLKSSNPPASAGVFYCILDFLVISTLVKIPSFSRHKNPVCLEKFVPPLKRPVRLISN